MEFVFRLLMLWFTIYTLAVCPADLQLKSPVCRGLAQYRALVIEPYILPPIEHALAHPSVAPYVAKVKPYVDKAVRTTKPVAARVHKEFNARVVPQWNKRVVPLYHKYAVPQLVKLDAQTAPYRTRVGKEYEQLLAPYVRRTASTVYQLQEQARPYVVLAAQKTYQGYQVARPYARPMWEKTKAVLAQLAAVLGEQRRQFVDPHVQKIWEHVKEMSSGKPLASSTPHVRSATTSQPSKASSQVSQASAKVSSSLSSVLSSAVSGSTAISSSVAQTASSATSETVSSSKPTPVSQSAESAKSSVVEAGYKASSAVSSASSALKSTASVISESLSASVSSSVSATSDAVVAPAGSHAAEAQYGSVDSASFIAGEIPSAASSLVESGTAAAHDGASQVLSSVARSAASSASDSVVGSSGVVSATASVAAASVADSAEPSASPEAAGKTEHDDLDFLSDPDLDAFKAELGLSEEDLLSDPLEASGPAEPHVETEEEREARLEAAREKTTRDRAAIQGRHVKWETQVVEEIQAKKKALRKTLVAIRKAAVVELKGNEEIRNEVDNLIEDGEKFLRGAEKYLANLRKESRKIEEKRTIWDRIVGKVEEKFTDRLHQTEAVVNGWYKGVLDNELAEVDKLTTEIKDLAERAQADIGLDYAYLDDVTYQDWQRYHDLIRRSENFTAHAHSVQDGTHPSPPINPVTVVIKELQDEVDDVIAGFNARLRKIKRSGARVFGSPVPADEEEQEDESVSILPIEDSEQTETPGEASIRNVAIGRGKGEVDAPSILPIEDSEQTETRGEASIRNVAIGRGKGEVEAALNRVAEADAQKTSSPGAVGDADTVAQSLSDEIASEETPDAAAPVHQEL
ncbi:hypothetical protein LXA43DRAFT_217959 [Ganoderma leucocontextum]|nr:hypothetical protein LXA43DRAFT_217959 [Ganoderma leucocontextum]